MLCTVHHTNARAADFLSAHTVDPPHPTPFSENQSSQILSGVSHHQFLSTRAQTKEANTNGWSRATPWECHQKSQAPANNKRHIQ